MKKIYLFLVLAGLSLAACHEVTVGYMKTEHAAYPVDSLQIFDSLEIRNEIARLEAENVSLADSLQFAMDSLLDLSREMRDEYEIKYFKEVWPLYKELNELLKDSVNHVGEIINLKEKIQQKEAVVEPIGEKATELEDEAYEIRLRLENLDPSEGQADVSVLEALKKLRLRVTKRVAWTTSEIQGVDGTAPVFYSVVGIRAEKGGDADIFRSDLLIKGNGRMEVPYDFKAPTGCYHVSIRIENEGHSRILENVFTFIVNRVPDVD